MVKEFMDFQLIFYYKKTGKYALNVIAAALDSHPNTKTVPVEFISSHTALIAAIQQTNAQGLRPVVCWSFYSPDFKKITQELHHIQRETQQINCIHLAGGVHASAEPLLTLQAGFDYVAVGEGEGIIVDFVNALLGGDKLSNIRGIASLQHGKLQKNGKGEHIDLNHYAAGSVRYSKFGPTEITRGCIYACKFCQTPFVNKARFRHRSIESICTVISHMKAQNSRDYRFISPSSLSYGSSDESVNLDAIEDFLGKVRSILGTQGRLYFGTFPSEIRPEHISRQSLAILKRYVDNDNIIIGGQSGSNDILQNSHRGHDVDAVIRSVELSLQAGFLPNVDFLYGLPGETKRDAMASLKLSLKLSEMGAKIHNHTFMPLPGTPFRDQLPGNISQEVQQQIVKLTSQGKAYGKWQGHIKVAKQLAEMRNNQSEHS